jgi:sugar/nucleoside kinase (ribokinase family)
MSRCLLSSQTYDFDFFSVGQLSLDTIVNHEGIHGLFPGGGALYPAVVAAQLGLRSAVYGKVGKDFPLEDLRKIRAAGVNGEAIRQVGGASAKITIRYPRGSREKIDILEGVGYDLSVSEVPKSHWNSRIVHVSTAKWSFLRHFLERAGVQDHTLLSFAPKSDLKAEKPESVAKLLSEVDVLFLNEDELSLYAPGKTLPDRLANLARIGTKVVVVTLAEQGSLIQHGQEVHKIEPFVPLIVRNVCGAGDAYIAGFWFAYLQGYSLPDCGAFASRVAVCVMPSYGLPLSSDNFAPILSDPLCQRVMMGGPYPILAARPPASALPSSHCSSPQRAPLFPPLTAP